MSDQGSAVKMAKKPRIEAESLMANFEKMANNLEALSVVELRSLCEHLLSVCEDLREESARRTIALASAVHELRTPLAVMAGYIDVLRGEKAGPLGDKQRMILEDMQANESRLKRFIDDFLTFSASETKNLSMQLAVADLNACLKEVVSMWITRFQEKAVALYFLPGEDVRPFSFDSLKLQHVVSNLAHNALKFTPPHGTVWLTTENSHMERRLRQEPSTAEERRHQLKKMPKAVRVCVADTGPGIEPEFHQEIFEDFRKLAPGNTGDSMGLGLSISRRLVQAHGGRIWVESQTGSGSKFCFLIPTGDL